MSLITSYDTHVSPIGEGRGLLSTDPGVQRRQISRINAFIKGDRFDPKKNRAVRKARYKQKLERSRLEPELRHAIDINPMQHGGPRAFKVLLAGRDTVAGRKVHDTSFFEDEGHFVHFSAFGVHGAPIRLNDTWVKGDDITLSPEKNIYTISTREDNGAPLSMFLDFTLPERPTGSLSVAQGQFAIHLQPYAVTFNVKAAANCGAYYSSGEQTLLWDETSSEWQSAKWEDGGMQFSYDTIHKKDPFGKSTAINEAAFNDLQAQETFDLTADGKVKYSAIMDGTHTDGARFLITVPNPDDIPLPPGVRATSDVKSVFPAKCLLKFDAFGTSFTGAYMLPTSGLVYGVIGTGLPPGGLDSKEMKLEEVNPMFLSAIKPMPHPLTSAGVSDSGLDVSGLTNLNPSQPDSSSPTGFRDVVAEAANNDINTIITYYMDDDIRTTFVQAAPIEFNDPTVQAIATDSTDNAAFYKTLQVPYVVSSLFRSTLPEGRQCNSNRAQAKLRNIPAQSAIYKRHSDALYRHHYLKQFPSIQNYLDDQANGKYSSNMASAAQTMKTHIADIAQDMGDRGDPKKAAENLKTAQDDIDSLCAWATDKRLFWAFDLYYWCVTYYLPNLSAQAASAATSSTVSRQLKSLSGTFGVLEGSEQNPNGKSFQQAFNDIVRVYMMVAMIPQFVDAEGQSEDFDSILKAMLEQFYQENSNSKDPDIAKEAQNAKVLAGDDAFRRGLFGNLAISMRMGGTLGSWASIVQKFNNFNERSQWYQKLVKYAGIGATLARMACVGLLVVPMLKGGWKSMSVAQKTAWITTAVALSLTFAIKGIQGALRLNVFWEDLSGFSDCFKAFFGFDSVLKELPAAAERTESELAQWFLRTGPESMEITEDVMTTTSKLFGRCAGEFLTNAVGSLLAGVNIVLSAIDIAKTTDPLQKTMDSLMIISSGLQLLAIGASWIVGAGLAAEGAVAVLEMVAACSGPLAIVFAVAGLIVMIVMMFLHKDPPNPVQDFLDKHAAPEGLKMPYETDIDSFNVVPPDSSSNSLNGIAFGSGQTYLKLGAEDASTSHQFGIESSADITYYPDTCWSVTTNYLGNTSIFTYALDSKNNRVTICLGKSTDGKLQAVPPPAKVTTDSSGNSVPVDPKVYAEELARQQWKCTCTSKATPTSRDVDGKTENFTKSANFEISQGDQWLITTQSGSSWNIGLGDKNAGSSTWTLDLLTLGPAPFQYVQPDWQLTTANRDESDAPNFSGPTSTPLQWSISPTLPSFLQLAESAKDGGTISQVKGTAPTVMKGIIYTVTATMTIVGKTYSQKAQVTITVSDPNVPPSSNSESGVATALDGEKASLFSAFSAPDAAHAEPPQASQLNLSEINQDFDKFMDDAPKFFKWNPTAAVELSQHYTAAVAISRMQVSLQGSWRGGDYESLFFPSPSSGPSVQAGDPCDYHSAANAYVAVAIGNGDGYAKQYCNFDSAQTTINTFNTKLWDTNPDRFIEWLKWDGSAGTTGGLCKYDEYVNCIESRYWLAEKAAEQTSGHWPNQSMEMFFHFLKLATLGATDDQIASIYKTITTPDGEKPVLNPSGFSDITPSTWRSYRSYLLPGNIAASQLNVSNLGHETQYAQVVANGMGGEAITITSHADTAFLANAGYYKNSGGGSCFRAGTRVQMADLSFVPIENIQPGDMVHSKSVGRETFQARRVAFVSRPELGGRALYAYERIPDVLFTATHPLCVGVDEYGSPILAFVDVHDALRLNPLWGVFTLQTVPPNEITQVTLQNDETLFDIVFEADTDFAPVGRTLDIPTFVVQSETGESFPVCSEAPDAELLSATAAFVLSFAKIIGSYPDEVLRFFPDGLAAGVLDYGARIRKHQSVCAHEAQKESAGTEVSMATAVDILNRARLGPQTLADSIQAIIGSLGLSLEVIAENGWQEFVPKQPPSPHNRDQYGVISTHLLQLVQPALVQAGHSHPELLGLPASYERVLAGLARIFLSGDTHVEINLAVGQDHGKAPDNKQMPTPIETLGPHMARLRSNITLSETPHDVRYTLAIRSPEFGTAVLWARGSVNRDAADARWPVYINSLGEEDLIGHEIGCWHVGWLVVSWGEGVPEEGLPLAEEWAEASKEETRAADYMWLLGREVGRDVLGSLLGAPSG